MNIVNEMIRRTDEAQAHARGISIEQVQAEREQQAEESRRTRELDTEANFLERLRERSNRRLSAMALAMRLGFGPQYVLPAIAVRLSGLSERSNGDGRARPTVVHLLAVEAFKRGRIERRAGQFICTDRRMGFDVSEQDVETPITCPRCRRIAGLDAK